MGGAGAIAPAAGADRAAAEWPRRLVVGAILYLVRSGCAWRMPPRCFPPWPTVSTHLRRRWRLDGTLRRVHDRSRTLARVAGGRRPEPSVAVIDSQTARATRVGGPARGHAPAKRTAGRKRRILVDAAGIVPPAHIHAASSVFRASCLRLPPC